MNKLNNNEDVTINQLLEVYDKLTKIFGESPVIIGGKAINFLCKKNRRATKDIDLVISDNKISDIKIKDCSDPESIVSKLIAEGFELKWNKNNSTLKSLNYQGVDIDLYYSRPLNGICIEDIIKFKRKSNNIKKSSNPIYFANPVIMLLMKYDSNRDKDKEDVDRLLDTYWKSNTDLESNTDLKSNTDLESNTDLKSNTDLESIGLFIKNNIVLLKMLLAEYNDGKNSKKGNKMNKFLKYYKEAIENLKIDSNIENRK